ncbi:MAG: hypothetical protein ACOX1M_04830 [Erysipelotrichaceae bacterium]
MEVKELSPIVPEPVEKGKFSKDISIIDQETKDADGIWNEAPLYLMEVLGPEKNQIIQLSMKSIKQKLKTSLKVT